MAVKSFTIYDEYYELIKNLKKSEKKELLLAIFEYMFEDKEPKLTGMSNAIFVNLKRPLNVSKKRSKSGSITNQNDNQNDNQTGNQNDNQNEIKTKSNEVTNTTTHQDVDVIVYVNDNIINFIESNFNRTISGYEYEILNILQKKYGEKLLLCALKKSLEAGKTSMNYYKGILKNWESDGIKTPEEAMNEFKNKPEDDYWNVE